MSSFRENSCISFRIQWRSNVFLLEKSIIQQRSWLVFRLPRTKKNFDKCTQSFAENRLTIIRTIIRTTIENSLRNRSREIMKNSFLNRAKTKKKSVLSIWNRFAEQFRRSNECFFFLIELFRRSNVSTFVCQKRACWDNDLLTKKQIISINDRWW